jgi:hypothetical protein
VEKKSYTMLEYFGFSKEALEAVSNSPWYQLSWGPLVLVGLVSGYFAHQYGREIKRFDTPIRFTTAVYVIGLTIYQGNAGFMQLYLHVLFGFYLAGWVINNLLRNYYIGPDLSSNVQTKVNLNDCELILTHPKTNNDSESFFKFDADSQPVDYEPVKGLHFLQKEHLRRRWSYYNGKGEEIAGIKFIVSEQKMQGSADLLQIKGLNNAAAHIYFANFISPNDESGYFGLRYERELLGTLNWKLLYVQGIPIVSYRVPVREDYWYQYIHCALSSHTMLTFQMEIITDKMVTKKHEQLVADLFEGWILQGCDRENEFEKDRDFMEISPPKLDPFSVELMSNEEYRDALRERARDKVAWSVFEKTDIYDGWSYAQYKKLEEEFESVRKAYIRKQLDKLGSV